MMQPRLIEAGRRSPAAAAQCTECGRLILSDREHDWHCFQPEGRAPVDASSPRPYPYKDFVREWIAKIERM